MVKLEQKYPNLETCKEDTADIRKVLEIYGITETGPPEDEKKYILEDSPTHK